MDDLSELTERYRRIRVLVDTNLLLLLLIGTFDTGLIEKFKRTMIYSVDDFLLLQTVLEPFNKIITTPYILTELNSFANQLPAHLKIRFSQFTAAKIRTFEEVYIPGAELVEKHEYLRFGLTDTATFYTARGKFLALTDDLPLYTHLLFGGVDAVSFARLRSYLL